MSHPPRDDMQTWDRLFDFVSASDDQFTRDEVRAELKRFGIDPSSAVSKVRAALGARLAQSKLATARQKRGSMTTKLFGVVSQSTEQMRGSIRQIIAERFEGSGQAAYFRKLDEAASDQDLQSLMDDLARLDALTRERRSDDDDEGK